MKIDYKTVLKHFAAICIFLLLVCVYFAPAIFQGKILMQHDVVQFQGMSKEASEYAQSSESNEHEVIGWTGSMFSGMPTYTITTQKGPANFLEYLEIPFKAIDDMGGSIVFLGMLCFYILMCVLGANFWLAIAGAIAFAFGSYNIIILDAGHITKAYVMAYMPLTFAGMLLLFKEKWLWGSLLTILGVALSIKNNHIQITYYLAIFCFIIYLAYLFQSLTARKYNTLAKVTGVLIICVIVGTLPNVGKLYANYEMGQESMRGGSELTEVTKGEAGKESSGLDIEYAFAWSYSKAETMTLMIPNFYGGVSKPFDQNSETYKAIMSNLRSGKISNEDANTLYGRGREYWGDQPFTSGPVYFGAIICFLFLLGMFVIKNPAKWWILGGTIFFVFLSWGRNLMWFNEFLFNYLPMYNKFRTPSMALVIPGLTFPLIGIWGLKEIFSGNTDKLKLRKYVYYSVGVTGGLCLLFWLFPGMLSFHSVNDINIAGFEWYNIAMRNDRIALLKSDAFRSLVFIILGAGAVLWYTYSKSGSKTAIYTAIVLCLLILIDLWAVDKRYVNNDSFKAQKITSSYQASQADQFILQDKDESYRVLNLNNPFNETYTSYYHKSIGGYNAAKLGRYQELIDYRITGEMQQIVGALQHAKTYADLDSMQVFQNTPTLNMLNMRYVIFNPEGAPIVNPYAFGNAWFVNDFEVVRNADSEIAALGRIDPKTTALVDERFINYVSGFDPVEDENATIELVKYEPVKMTYKSNAASEQLAVFSEIYYPHGWHATIDGVPAEHFRVDWILRGMFIPEGEHTIEFRFQPKTYIAMMRIASISSLLIVLYLLFVVGWSLWKGFGRKEEV